jgi:Leucine-rich repeat (LRR) protein
MQVDTSGNVLTQLPGGFRAACKLLSLNASGNRLALLPDGLFSGMSSLTSLDLACNLLAGCLPSDIGTLAR